MDAHDYFERYEKIQNSFLNFIDKHDERDDEYRFLCYLFCDPKNKGNKNELTTLINIIANISNSHHHFPDFYKLVEQIILLFADEIKHFFTNIEIFNFFKNNKRILLFLFLEKIVIPDETISKIILDMSEEIISNDVQEKQNSEYATYFYPEIKEFIGDEIKQNIEKKIEKLNMNPDLFEEKRKIGENDNYICTLIQNDQIEDFISYVCKTNFKLSSNIKPSVFETNSFLINKKCPSLIEYSTFCGSIQIIKYLFYNKVELTPSLWKYAIHGNNPDLIHFLEENDVQIKSYYYKEYLREAIKCHHNEIANYFLNNFFENADELLNYISFSAIKYYNFSFYPDIISNNIFNYLCELNCFSVVEELLNYDNLNVNIKSALIAYTKKEKYDIVDIIIKCKGIFNRAFEGCSSLKYINIPSSTTSIGDNSFNGCKSLIQIIIPSAVTVIGKYAFSGCSALEKVTFENLSSLELIDNYAFDGCISLSEIKIPSSVTKIGMGSFNKCSSLVQIIIPSSVTEIEGGSFIKCSSLQKISIQSSSIKFGLHVFDGITSVILTDDMLVIPAHMFSGCSSLTNVIIPQSVTSIENHAFEKCTSLISLVIPSSVTSIENYAFDGCSSLIEITLPLSIKKIGGSAFKGCKSITQISIPSSVISIKNYTFANCSSLTHVAIPSSVKSIGNYSFYGCSSLEKISIPQSVTWIGSNSFDGCSSLAHLSIPSSVISIGKNAFPNKTEIIKINN